MPPCNPSLPSCSTLPLDRSPHYRGDITGGKFIWETRELTSGYSEFRPISFSDKEDLLKKINYYLIHEQERESIAQSGRKKVLKLYNSELFLKKIFEHKDFINE